jgi:hypothetical protein
MGHEVRDIRELMISIATDGDDSELDALRLDLSEELSMLPINAIEPVTSGEAPPNTRGFDAAGLGEIIVKAGPDQLRRVVNATRSWLRRSSARSVDLALGDDLITLSKATDPDQERILDRFIAKHQPADGQPG